MITYVAPVVALALGVVALGERPGPGAFVGLVLILAGSWLATRGARVERSRRPSDESRTSALKVWWFLPMDACRRPLRRP